MKLGIDTQHLAAICVVAGCVSALLFGAARLGMTILDGQALVDETMEAQGRLRDLEAAVAEMESSQRGFLLTLRHTYLDAYRDAAHQAVEAVDVLGRDSRGDAWNGKLARLQTLTGERRVDMDRALARARAGDVDGARAIVSEESGKATMDQLRAIVADMNALQSQTWKARRAAEEIAIRRSLQGASALGALGAGLLVVLFIWIGRERAANRAMVAKVTEEVHALQRQARMDKDELERSSRELHLSQAQLAGIIDTASAVILTVDRHQMIVLANQAAAQVFGITRDDLIGSPLERLIPHRFRASHARDVRAFAAGNGEARPMGLLRDVTALRANGEEFPIDASISLLRSGEREWYTVVLQDVTERRRSEAALLATTSKLKAALSSMNDAVYIVDSDGHPRDLNQAFATFHRFASRAECLQAFARQPDFIELSDLDGKPVQPDQWVVPRALRGETASNVEFRLRRKDSGETWIGSYNFAPIRVGGAIVGAVAIGRDITEIRAAQAELERSRAELRLLIAAQDRIQEQERKRIARELHDDLQQTLSAIRMDASEVRDGLADKPDGAAPLLAEMERLAKAAIVSIRRIVNDLRPEMLEELGLVAALTTLSGQYAERTGTPCTVVAAEGVGLLVNHEPALATCLYRVTQEALNNAAKHARATSVQVSLVQVEPSLIRLRISDDGVGMVKGAPRASQSFGLLGMAERVRAMGAHLRIDGNHDGGTTVEVLAPIRAQSS